MKSRNFFPIILLVLISTSLPAATLTLSQAQDLAVSSNLAVKSSTLDLKAAQKTSEINNALPSISLSAGMNASTGLFSTQQTSIGANVGVGASFKLFDGDKYTVKTRLINVENAKLSVETKTSDARIQVTNLYWNVVAQDLNVKSLSATLESMEKNHQANLQRYEAGQIDSLTLSQSELSLFNVEQNLLEATLSYQSAQTALKDVIGEADLNDLDELLEIRQLKEIDSFTSDIFAAALVKQSQLAVENAKVSYDSARYTATKPTLSLSASVGLSASYSTSANIFSISDSYSGSVSMSIPTDSWFKNSAISVNLENLDTAIQQASLSVQQAKDEAMDEVQEIYDNIDKCIRNQETLNKKQVLLETQLKLIQQAYDGGLTDYLSLLEADENVFLGNLSILQNQLDYTIYVSILTVKLSVTAPELFKEEN
jgi:outer membrane protein TolC